MSRIKKERINRMKIFIILVTVVIYKLSFFVEIYLQKAYQRQEFWNFPESLLQPDGEGQRGGEGNNC